ncbi:hypothetical protein [Lichenifustis flavocetrariae]|uniref:PilZ domain-containing protein n=1 Tax=Lichenifustis flavocetrariae TaxID=2949735 RepID=A0AA41Z4L0_9HYPH|nr:hypothetical protein [Lichenifustis flavocetrariae]MCW6510373.1 hypothetical protein [Lichenifustis flavocetrariae]
MDERRDDDILNSGLRSAQRLPHPAIAGLLAVSLVILLAIAIRSMMVGGHHDAAWERWGLAGVVLVLALLTVASVFGRRSVAFVPEPASRGVPSLVPPLDARGQGARRHRRLVPGQRVTTLHMQDGQEVPARIVDVSMSGVAVEAAITDLQFATVLRVGSRSVGPIRRTLDGAVFRFATLLDPLDVDHTLIL